VEVALASGPRNLGQSFAERVAELKVRAARSAAIFMISGKFAVKAVVRKQMNAMRSLIFFTLLVPIFSQGKGLEYSPAPVDNPLKGLVPYTNEWKKDERFPHSMEFCYFHLSDVMTGWGAFDWSKVEESLEKTRAGGRQAIFRIVLEYPGKTGCLPDFFLKEEVKITRWKDGDGKDVVSPDYASSITRRAIDECITAMGEKYDGDPRVAFITAGMLGLWGEWHSYPRTELMASKEVQREVVEAFEKAFSRTHILLRYPAGENDWAYADNREAQLGYHDDSFAWATIETGKKGDEWFFVPKLKAAGLLEKWKKFPMGGEIRPEIWPTVFTEKVTGQQQDFMDCLEQSHVSWLMDSGMTSQRYPLDEKRTERASKAVSRMGYELHISEAAISGGTLTLTVENRGVAPFYYDWPVELKAGKVIQTTWKLSEVLPGEPVKWTTQIPESGEVFIRVPNPMKGGRDLKFANAGYQEGWLQLR
jgi:hypothetical protein